MMLEKRTNWGNRIALSILVLISIAVVITHYREGENGPLHRIQNSAISLLSPIQVGAFSVVRYSTNVWESITRFGSLKTENKKLKKDNASLRRQAVVEKELELENRRLREQLNAPIRRDYQTLFATVIGKSVSNWQATIELDKGLDDGVRKDQAVATSDGLAGHVTKVNRNSCLVQLITDQKCAVGARLQSSRATAIVKGQGGQELNLVFLPREIKVDRGELLLTSGIGGVYPPGIVVGTVSAVAKKPRGFYHEITVSPAVDFWTLEEVFIVTGEK